MKHQFSNKKDDGGYLGMIQKEVQFGLKNDTKLGDV